MSGSIDIEPLVPFFLPAHPKTLLLRTITAPGSAVLLAWEEWLRLAGADPVREIAGDRIGLRKLMPVILSRLEAAGCVIPSELRTVMRTARTREKLRWETLAEICAKSLAGLATDGVDFTVTGGITLAASAFEEPWERHSHDLDLLAAPRVHDRIVGVLRATGLTWRGVTPAGATIMEHPSGLPVVVHRHPLDEPAFQALGALLENELVETELFGVECRTLDSTAALAHVMARAVESRRARNDQQWVVDAAALIGRADETRFEELIARSGAASLIERMKTFATALTVGGHPSEESCMVSEDVVRLCLRSAAGSWRGWNQVWRAVPGRRFDLVVATLAPPAELVDGGVPRGALGYGILLVIRAVKFVGRAIAWRMRSALGRVEETRF